MVFKPDAGWRLLRTSQRAQRRQTKVQDKEMCGFIEQQLRGCGEKHRQSSELSTEFSLIGVTLCSRLKHIHSHCWRVSSIFSVILMTHVSVFRLSRVEPECLPCLTYGGLFPERVGPVCLSVCLWLGGRASQETAHKHTDTHRVFVSCLNKGGR